MKIRDNLSAVLFPEKCSACGMYLDKDEIFLCSDCKTKITRIEPPYCEYCGVGKKYCKCRAYPRAYDSAVAPFYYDGAIKSAIYRLKFGSHESVARYLSFEMSREIEARYFGIDFDILTCVPTSGKSLAKRGFNQSRSIAECLTLDSAIFPSIHEDYALLIKDANISTQHLLGAEARRRNTERAYRMNKNKDVRGKTILLIDDILTTGTTANACASILKLAGAKSVYTATASIAKIDDDKKVGKNLK